MRKKMKSKKIIKKKKTYLILKILLKINLKVMIIFQLEQILKQKV